MQTSKKSIITFIFIIHSFMISIGKEPFSEPESRNIREILLLFEDRMHAFFDIQSYGQFWLTPYGYTRHTPDFHSEMVR